MPKTYYSLHDTHFYFTKSCPVCQQKAQELDYLINKNKISFAFFGLNSSNTPFFTRWDSSIYFLSDDTVNFYDLSAVTLRDEDTMFICGGVGRCENVVSNELYEYSFSANRFSRLPDMNDHKYDFPIFYANNKIFAVGGTVVEDNVHIKTRRCEVFDYQKMKWNYISDLNAPRSASVLFSYNNALWCLGGIKDNYNIVTVIERYLPNIDRWEILDFKFPVPLKNIQIYPTQYPNEVYIFGEHTTLAPSHVLKLNLLHQTIIYCQELSFTRSKIHSTRINENTVLCLFKDFDKLAYSIFRFEEKGFTLDTYATTSNIVQHFDRVNAPKSSITIPYLHEESKSYLDQDYTNRLFFFGNIYEPFQIEMDNKTSTIEVLPVSTNLRIGKNRFICRISSNVLFIICEKKMGASFFSQKAFLYNLNTREIIKIPQMLVPKHYVILEKIDNYVYAIGPDEFLPRGQLKPYHSERFDLVNQKWEYLGPLHLNRSHITSFQHNNKVYVCGSTKHQRNIEVFNNDKKRWEICHVPLARLGMGWNIVSHNHDLIAFEYKQNVMTAFKLSFGKGDLMNIDRFQLNDHTSFNLLRTVIIDGNVFVINYQHNTRICVYKIEDLISGEDKKLHNEIQQLHNKTFDFSKLFTTEPNVFCFEKHSVV